MNAELIAGIGAYREKFIYEDFCSEDDILAICADGSFEVKNESTSFVVKESEGFVFRKNVLYHRKILEKAMLFLFRYRSNTTIFETEHIKFSEQSRIKSTISLLSKLDTEPFADDFTYRQHYFHDIVNQYRMENRIPCSSDTKEDALIEKAIAYMKDHLEKSPSEICAVTGLSYVHFIRRFKDFTGFSPGDYLKHQRIRRAKELLLGTNLLIKEISLLCGFENEYYFSNCFRKNSGLSPTQFRNTTK